MNVGGRAVVKGKVINLHRKARVDNLKVIKMARIEGFIPFTTAGPVVSRGPG